MSRPDLSLNRIRNFCIIAHVDHGKSTLSDRFIEICGAVDSRQKKDQMLDDLELERERGITIKARSVALPYTSKDTTYQLNLIDTPGHVDFSYEVQRSLAACEGAVLLVDATQGVQAQTVAHCFEAVELGLEVIPVLNKVDVSSADPQSCLDQLRDIIGIEVDNVLEVSGKTGQGVPALLEQIIEKIPAPEGDSKATSRILITDAWFDPYLGVLSSIRVGDGYCKPGQQLKALSSGYTCKVEECGIFTPTRKKMPELKVGQFGYVSFGIKDIRAIPVGDTLISAESEAKDSKEMARFVAPKPLVFTSIFPADSSEFSHFNQMFERLLLTDAAVTYDKVSVDSLGQGFRCGFLGTLHMEVVMQRLEKEFDLDLVATTPSVEYEVTLKNGDVVSVANPSELPDANKIDTIAEPFAEVYLLLPEESLGKIIDVCQTRRGRQKSLMVSAGKATLTVRLPMAELMGDFFDRIKAVSHGYASVDYQLVGFETTNIKKMDILINGDEVSALAELVHNEKIRTRGLALVDRLQTLIPRQMFEVALQAASNGKVVARANVKALRKNVTAKCYGGDITRKKKLLEKQKKGKKAMRSIGRVQVPREVFTNAKHGL